jgi:Tfp pilus assembly pilus retraction ATPase PilT
MVTMNQSLKKLLDVGVISAESALSYTNNPEELQRMMGLTSSPRKK